MDIPQTRAAFQQLPFMEQHKIKKRLLQTNYSALCSAINPEDLADFSPALHESDMETLLLSRNHKSRTTVNMNLLSHIQRSFRKNPAFWEILDSYFINRLNDKDLYFAMNPWDQTGGYPDGGAAGEEGRGREGPEAPTPSLPRSPPPRGPRPMTSPTPRPPYPKCTPLAETKGIALVLRPLCDNCSEWRDLAEAMGLVQRDQQIILQRSQGGDIHRILLDVLEERLGEAANIQLLTTGLLELGDRGRAILDRLMDRGLIQPLEGEGSAAVGEVVGAGDDSVENGSTSTLASRVPTPRVPAGHGGLARPCSGVELGHSPGLAGPGRTSPGNQLSGPAVADRNIAVDGSPPNPARSGSPPELNLSSSQPVKDTPQPTLDGIIPQPPDPAPSGLSRSRSAKSRGSPRQAAVHRAASQPAPAPDTRRTVRLTAGHPRTPSRTTPARSTWWTGRCSC